MSISIQELKKLKSVTAEDDERLIKEEKKEYNAQYYSEHKEELKERQKSYNAEHKEEIIEHNRKYYSEHKEERKTHNEGCKEKIKEYNKRYYSEHKEELKEHQRSYNARHKEEKSEYNRKYNDEHKEETSEYNKNYGKKYPELQKRYNTERYRKLGYEEILPVQWGCVQHHVDDNRVIPIPEVVHQKLSGYHTKKHRELVDEWMKEIRPDLWMIVHIQDAFERCK